MKTFRRRIYPSLRAFWKEFKQLFADRKKIRASMRDDQISACFRERLMLTVTSVNQCRYCAYAHSRQALLTGITPEEIWNLCNGTFDHCSEEELPALLYAQHWAECNGEVDERTREKLIAIYGQPTADSIEMAIRLIQMGNLLGNTFDYFLYRITFGRLGLLKEEREAPLPLKEITP